MALNQRQSIGRNAIYLVVEPVLFAVIGVIVSGYVARSIGASEYGRLIFALTFINFFTLFTNLGLNNYLMNGFAVDPEGTEREFIPVLVIRLTLAAITYSAGCVGVNLLGYPAETKMIFYAAGLIVFGMYLGDSCEGVFKGYEQMQYMGFLKILNSIVLQSLRWFVVFLGLKAFALAWTRVGVGLVMACVSLYVVYSKFLKFSMTFRYRTYRKIIFGTLPFAFSTSFLIIYNRLDIIMLSYFTGDESVAYYKTAHLFIEKMSILTVAIVGAVYPAIARLFSLDRKKAVKLYSRTFIYLFLVSVPLAVGGVMLSEKIILLIFGTQYLEAVPVAKLLFASLPVLFATSIMGNILMAINEATIFSYIMTILCVTNIIANLILIPIYAQVGAAIATLFSQCVTVVVLIYFTGKKFGMFSIDMRFFKIIVSVAVMASVLHLTGDKNLFLLVVIGVICYFLSIVGLKTFQKTELVELKDMILRKRG